MAHSSYEERRGLTFAQAEGVEPLPSQLKRTEVPRKLSALVWVVLHRETTAHVYTSSLTGDRYVDGRWEAILRDYHVFSQHRPIDEFSSRVSGIIETFKSVVYSGDYILFYEFLQFVVRHDHCTPDFVDEITECLQVAHAPFTLVGQTLMPVGSQEETAAVTRAFADTTTTRLAGHAPIFGLPRKRLRSDSIQTASARAFTQLNRPRGLSPHRDRWVTL